VRAAVEVDRVAVVVVVVLLAAVVLVVLLAAELLEVAAAVVGLVPAVEPRPAELVSPVVATAAALVAVVATDWSAMPRPRALATPMLSEATSARLRAAGWGRFVLMGDERTDRP
jgi:hypothetical protein